MTAVQTFHAAQDAYYRARTAMHDDAVRRTGKWMSIDAAAAHASKAKVEAHDAAKARLDATPRPYGRAA